jgi:DNA-binding LacI/PurR family transcriptional regulator
MAIGALSALGAKGLRVPQDVSLVGFDDIAEARLTAPPLTTLAQPIGEIGRRATEMVLERVSSKAPIPHRQVLLDVELVERESCAHRESR